MQFRPTLLTCARMNSEDTIMLLGMGATDDYQSTQEGKATRCACSFMLYVSCLSIVLAMPVESCFHRRCSC